MNHNLVATESNEGFESYLISACTKEEIEKLAHSQGAELELPASNELFLDIDTFAQMDIVKAGLALLDSNSIRYTKKVLTSKSGNKHIIITLPFMVSNELRVAFQAALGSDPKRELLACLRLVAGAEVVTAFFRKVTK